MEMNTKTPSSEKPGKYHKMSRFYIRSLEKILSSLPPGSTKKVILCVGTGKAGEINKLLTKKRQTPAVLNMKRDISGGLITILEYAEYPTVTINQSSIMFGSKTRIGSWDNAGDSTQEEPDFTENKTVGTLKH